MQIAKNNNGLIARTKNHKTEEAMKEKEIVNKKHPYWHGLNVRLSHALADKGCDHSFDLTETILFTLPNVDVGGTLDFFMRKGGFCDCEIYNNVLNAAPRPRKSKQRKRVESKLLI